MIRNKIEVEIILTDSGNLRLCSNGASYLIASASKKTDNEENLPKKEN